VTRVLLVVGVSLVLCLPAVLLGLLQNLRDRREARLLSLVTLHTGHLRGCVSIQVKSRLLWPASRVTLHMWLCSPEQRWRTLTSVVGSLPARVTVSAEGPLCPGVPSLFRVRTRSDGRPRSSLQASGSGRHDQTNGVGRDPRRYEECGMR